MEIDVAGLVTAYKEQEKLLVARMEPDERAKYMENRAFKSEEVLAEYILSNQKAELIKKYPAVEIDDLSDVSTVSGAEKLAAKLQAKADKQETQFKEKQDKFLEGTISAVEFEKYKKAYGKPRQPQDETQNQVTDAEQRQEIGAGLQGKPDFDFGGLKSGKPVKALGDAAKHYGDQALNAMLGGQK